MPPAQTHIHMADWGLLLILSVLWGGSFLFVGIAVRDVSPLVIVMARVVIAAAALLPFHWLMIGALPKDRATWLTISGMSLLTNVIPFTLIVTGQTMITSGLASVINATTPLFGVAILAAAGREPLVLRKVVGILVGIAGVAVLKGGTLFGAGAQSVGILLCLGAAMCYGIGSLWAKLRLKDTPPLSLATGQLLVSSAIMAVLAFAFDDPSQLLEASLASWLSLLGLAILATSLAYIIFFRVVARSGPANVLLVTMMIPVSAIAMGVTVLCETLEAREVFGAIIILLALLIIDGRLLKSLRFRQNPA